MGYDAIAGKLVAIVKIIKKSSNQLVMEEVYSASFVKGSQAFGLGAIGISLLIFLTCLLPRGVESLACRRVASDRVDCTHEKSTLFGLWQFPTQSLPFVNGAKYNASNDSDSSNHRLQLILRNGSRPLFFEAVITVNGHKGDPKWVGAQVAQLKRLFAYNTDAVTVRRDNRFTLGSAILFGVAAIVLATGGAILFATSSRETLRCNKATRKLTQQRTLIMDLLWEKSYPFSQVRAIVCTINVNRSIGSDFKTYKTYSITIALDGSHNLFIVHNRTQKATLLLAEEIAGFLNVELRTDERTAAGSGEKQNVKIIQKSSNQLVIPANRFFARIEIILGLGMTACSLLFFLVFVRPLGFESLTCRRVAGDRVDCTHEKATWIGLRQFPTRSLPFVVRAEYRTAHLLGFRDDHFQLIFKNGDQQRVFEPSMLKDGVMGNQEWGLAEVEQLERFFASNADTVTIQRTNRFPSEALFELLMVMAGFFLVIGAIRLFGVKLRMTLCFDKSDRKLKLQQATIIRSWEISHPFSQVSEIVYTIDEDSDGESYDVVIALNNADNIYLRHYLLLCRGRELLQVAQEIADFLNVELRTDDRTNKSP